MFVGPWCARIGRTATPIRGGRAGFESLARYLSEKIEVAVEWVTAGQVVATHDSYRLGRYFDEAWPARIYDRLGVAQPYRVAAAELVPLPRFHQLATRELEGVPRGRARLPYHSALFGQHQGEVNSVSALLFKGETLVTRVKATLEVEVRHDLRSTLSELIRLRSAKESTVAKGLSQAITETAQGRPRHYRRASQSDDYFAMRLRLPLKFGDLDAAVDEMRTELVALLIGTENAVTLQPGLVDRVFGASEDLNTKAIGEKLLINRQGMLYVLPSGEYRGPHSGRFDRTVDLAMLASYARTFLRSGHNFYGQDQPAAEDIVRRISQWVERPTIVFDSSVTQTLSWDALSRATL